MSIEQKSPVESQQEAWLKQASSDDIQNTQESQYAGNKLHKINTILWSFDFPDEQEDSYIKKLQLLDKGQLSALGKLGKTSFQKLLNKPQIEISQFLIQAQIDEINAQSDLSKDDKRLRYNLRKQLIAVEKQETEKNSDLITTENQKQAELKVANVAEDQKQKENSALIEAKLKAQDAQIAGLRGALLENAALKKNEKIGSLSRMITRVEGISKDKEWLFANDKKWLQEKLLVEVKAIEKYLQSPWNLESIAKELGWPKSAKYVAFKEQMLTIDGLDLHSSFDRVEIGFADHLAMIKLWTDNLDWVNIENDILIKTQWDFTIEAWKNNRNISLEWSNYKLPSKLDSKHEDQIEGLNQQSNKELAPFNQELTTLLDVLNLIQKLQTNGVKFEEAKTHIKEKYPETYNSLGLSSKNSYNDINFAIQNQKSQLEKSKEKIIKIITKKLEKITAQSKKEAQEKDRTRVEVLRIFKSIGLDEIDQTKLTQIIDTVNLNHASYWLQQPIDLENGSLGFDFDFWNKSISFLEKKAFIGFINKMLWEDVINEDIASGTTSLQPESISRLRVLNNNIAGFFLANLNKQES